MKRHLLSALIIGLIAGGVVMALHQSGLLVRPERAIADLLSRQNAETTVVGNVWQYVFVFILALGVAWMTLATTRRARLGGIIAILLVELVGVAWVCSLYRVIFQPLPSLAGTALGFLLPLGFLGLVDFAQRRRERAPVLTPEAIAPRPPPRARRADVAPDAVARACEVTAVVCDIANKHDLAEECEPAVFIEITEKFLAHVSEQFRKAGAYIESAGGEGVVAIFGFPESDKQHAEKATRKAMALTQAFSEANKPGKSDGSPTVGVHAGVSSGIMIMAPVKNNGQRGMLATGEPVELARRFCIANRFYGSKVLLGPRTFELARSSSHGRSIS
jgi:class 3 adenylate cyclase